jgi:hypothetical protein
MNIPQPEHGGNGESAGVVNQTLRLRPIMPRSGLGAELGSRRPLPPISHNFRMATGV